MHFASSPWSCLCVCVRAHMYICQAGWQWAAFLQSQPQHRIANVATVLVEDMLIGQFDPLSKTADVPSQCVCDMYFFLSSWLQSRQPVSHSVIVS